jgi:hypothetical protein
MRDIRETNDMTQKYYAGIGSRNTPDDILIRMSQIAAYLELKGFTLRSGGAPGADSAFSDGCSAKEIYIPWDSFNGHFISPENGVICDLSEKHFELAKSLHPNWVACSYGAKKLHARNTQQILGRNLDSPVKFVVCWTLNGEEVGGTATAIRLAKMHDIPVYNLGKKEYNLS